MKKYIDKFLGRYWLGFVVATILLCFGFITAEVWQVVCIAFFTGGAISGFNKKEGV